MSKASSPAPPTNGPTNVLVVGVGGQGVIMVSKVLASLCQTQGYQVKQSEVHGMAKRGGSVFSHVRFGTEVWSPTIPQGQADILVALEWAEGLRWLPYLKPETGVLIADTQAIVPPFACRNRKPGATKAYPQSTPAAVIERVGQGYALDATRVATELGNGRAANTVLLGAMSTALDFPEADWLAVLERAVPPKTTAINRAAFERGRAWVLDAERPLQADAPVAAAGGLADAADVLWTLTETWCKGCDICVKMCPERCLSLNAAKKPVLSDPETCTGCRLCEWLCPDLAIRVGTQPAGATASANHPPVAEMVG